MRIVVMMTSAPTRHPLILDANILIDFQEHLEVLRAISQHVELKVLDENLREAASLAVPEQVGTWAEVVTATLEEMIGVGSSAGPLSKQDRLLLRVSARRGFTCVTNDKALIRACEREGVTTIRGFALLIRAAEWRAIGRDHAARVGQEIAAANSTHIRASVLDEFLGKLKKLA